MHKWFVILIFTFFSANLLAEDVKSQEKVVKTLVVLANYSEKQASETIKAIKAGKQKDVGPSFVKKAYESQDYKLDTAECKIIWKAIVVSVKTDKDGFDLMEVETPWVKP